MKLYTSKHLKALKNAYPCRYIQQHKTQDLSLRCRDTPSRLASCREWRTPKCSKMENAKISDSGAILWLKRVWCSAIQLQLVCSGMWNKGLLRNTEGRKELGQDCAQKEQGRQFSMGFNRAVVQSQMKASWSFLEDSPRHISLPG